MHTVADICRRRRCHLCRCRRRHRHCHRHLHRRLIHWFLSLSVGKWKIGSNYYYNVVLVRFHEKICEKLTFGCVQMGKIIYQLKIYSSPEGPYYQYLFIGIKEN